MDYQTIASMVSATYEVQRSIFICHLSHIDSFEEGIDFAKSIAKKYNDATHNCYAIMMQSGQQKFFDDGEPQGTAGMPILQVIKKQELFDVVAVVTRYFGGIKLGANGLVSSYTKATSDAIDKAEIVTKKDSIIGTICLNYTEYQAFIRQIKDTTHIVLDTEYDQDVKIKVAFPLSNKENAENIIALLSSGQKGIVWVDSGYIKY